MKMLVRWLLLSIGIIGVCSSDNNKLTILHTNDIHSHYDITNKFGTDCTSTQIDKGECWGGLGRLKRAVALERQKHPDSLLLDGGDQFQGTLYYTFYNGNLTAEAMNEVGYDVMTVGNHEFDHGPDALAKALNPVKFPIVAANVNATSNPGLNNLIKPYALFPKYKVAIVGYLTPTAPTISNLGSVEVIDPVKPVQAAIDEVRKLGYNRVIGLSHHGYREDMSLASQTRGLSLIVGGHSHTFLKSPQDNTTGQGLRSGGFYPTPVKNLDQETTYVVQAGCCGRFLGHLDLKFNDNGYLDQIEGAPIELNMKLEPDTHMDDLVHQWRIPFDAYSKTKLGELDLDLPTTSCQVQECGIGNLITDIMLKFRPNSNFSLINSGGIRAGLSQGDVTVGDVQVMLPFTNTIVDIELSGQRIWDLIESAVSKFNPNNNKEVTSFIQVSGLSFTYNPNLPPQSRLLQIKIPSTTSPDKWLPLNLTANYTLTTLDFIATGGDNLISPPIPNPTPLEGTDTVVMDYIKSHSSLHEPNSPRIIQTNETDPNQIPHHSNDPKPPSPNPHNSDSKLLVPTNILVLITSFVIAIINF